MKVAIISNNCNVTNGWGNITYEHCSQLLKNKIDFDLFLPKDHKRHPYLKKIKPKYVLPSESINYFPFGILNSMTFNYKDLPKNYDLIHCLFSGPECLIARKYAKKIGVPLIVGAQGTFALTQGHASKGIMRLLNIFKPISRYYYKSVLRACDKFQTPSEFTRDAIITELNLFDIREKSIIIHNGVNFPRFRKRVKPTGVFKGYGKKTKIIGVGALKLRKGFQISIPAVAEVAKEYPNLVYFIIGGGNQAYFQKLIDKLGVGKNVKLVGELNAEKLVEAYQECDFYMHTPVNIDWNFEGFGIVYLEANAAGKAALGSVSGGVPDAIIPEKTGLLAKENDIKDTAKQLKRLIKEKSYLKMQEDSVDWARNHDWSKITGKYLKIYEEVLR